MKIIHKIITQLSTSKALVLIDQAIVSGGNFLLGILLARFLGLEIFGLYSLLWMGVLFALSIHQAFMTKPLMSLFANRTVDAQQDYLQGLMVLQILVSVAIILLTNIVFIGLNISAVSNEWVGFLPLCGFLTASYLMQDFLRKTFFVKQRFSHPLLMDLVLYVPILMAKP